MFSPFFSSYWRTILIFPNPIFKCISNLSYVKYFLKIIQALAFVSLSEKKVCHQETTWTK